MSSLFIFMASPLSNFMLCLLTPQVEVYCNSFSHYCAIVMESSQKEKKKKKVRR